MKQSKLIDTAIIDVLAGDGGDGKVSFRREKHVAKGGPDGGDGGNGGSVTFVADHNMATLMDFKTKSKYKAQNGEPGGKKKMYGAYGEDLVIKVPVGTLIYELRDGEGEILVGDMSKGAQSLLIALGGIGGKGNTRFKSSTNRTPTQFTRGKKGQTKRIKLEIKLIADIGFVGLPNAGKSTLINHLTNSQAKVADYPFTTIQPNLGVWNLKNSTTVVIADIPGLIEGASQGKGLGDEFLRHVERTRVLLHIIDPFEGVADEITERALVSYKTIRKELVDYGAGLEKKPEIVAINKLDITEVKDSFKSIQEEFSELGISVVGISAVTGEGFDKLEEVMLNVLKENPTRVTFDVEEATKIFTIENLPNRRIVFNSDVEEMGPVD